ncbi:MAG: aldolase/citrate lyase family protein [Roseibium sp.]
MAQNSTSLARKLRGGETVVSGWSSLAVPIVVELLARGGYGAVTLDLQHGQHDLNSIREGLSALALAGAHGIVRIPVGDFATASRALDLGADAIIAPMINSADDAREFADYVKYPPVGKRSWGPHRAAMLRRMEVPEYLKEADRETLSFAMVETPEAVAALDDILDVPGIDGVFVGPADLSLTLSKGASLDPMGDEVATVAADIAKRTLAAGKIPAMFCLNPQMVKDMRAVGFRYLTCGVDQYLLMGAAKEIVEAT